MGTASGLFVTNRVQFIHLSLQVELAERPLQFLLALHNFASQIVRFLTVPNSFVAHRLNVRTLLYVTVHLHGARYPCAFRYPVCHAYRLFSEAAWFDSQLSGSVDIHISGNGWLGGVPMHKFICDQSMSGSDSGNRHPPVPSGNRMYSASFDFIV
eukprot:1938116-Prymnesium_polylepis.1